MAATQQIMVDHRPDKQPCALDPQLGNPPRPCSQVIIPAMLDENTGHGGETLHFQTRTLEPHVFGWTQTLAAKPMGEPEYVPVLLMTLTNERVRAD